jgi:putative ABC transport system permease protein
MDILPILSTLRRHRTAATLIVLQIALTCAIVSNAIFLIGERLARIDYPSGVAEDSLVRLQIMGLAKDNDPQAITAEDLAALAAIPGVEAAAVTNMIPFGESSWNGEVSPRAFRDPEGVNVAIYMGSQDLIETFGVRLIAGRDFLPEEYVDFEAMTSGAAHAASVIVTRGVAERLFPGGDAIGKPLYGWGERPHIIVGVVEHIARHDVLGSKPDSRWSVFFPTTLPYSFAGNYILRVDDPARRAEVLAAAAAAIEKVSPRIIAKRQSFGDIRRDHFEEDRAMAWLLVGVCVGLLVITALGIVGLASFWVQRRTRQIGIRRALGASRGQILAYFHTENFVLATAGIVLGMALAYGINLWLMDKYQVARLPAMFLPVGAILLWVLGQVAVVGPALRAAAVPPAVATRTV